MTGCRALRNMRVSQYDHLYTRKGSLGDPCIYCGVESNTWDHVPPLHVVDLLKSTSALEEFEKLEKFPCCNECNSVLGPENIINVQKRRAFVISKYRKKYKKWLKIPKWDDEDFEDMNPQFVEFIKKSSEYAEWIKKRISFYHNGER